MRYPLPPQSLDQPLRKAPLVFLTRTLAALIIFLGLTLFLGSATEAQTCGQVFSVSVSPGSFINATNPSFFQPPDGSPGFYAYGMVTTAAQACAGDPTSGLDVRVKDPSGNTANDIVLCDMQVTNNAPQTVYCPLRARLLVSSSTSFTILATVSDDQHGIVSSATTSFTELPFNPTFTVSPSQIQTSSAPVTATMVLDAPYVGTGTFLLIPSVSGASTGDSFVVSNSNGSCTIPSQTYCDLQWNVPAGGQTTFTFQIAPSIQSTQPETISLTADLGGGGSRTAQLQFAPPNDPGPCTECEAVAGQPINLSTGDVWISKTDYAVPGLSRGLSLSRTWNSLWNLNNPPFSAGMFGAGWTSDFEERLQTLDSTHLRYWLSSGNSWMLQQPSGCPTCAYSVARPLNEHASLVYNSSTALYTLTFVDGTTKTFSSTGYLTAVTDRNGNKTVVTYDSSNRISKVTAPGGQWLSFSYANSTFVSLATSAQDSVGTVATFAYTGNQLIQAAYPDGGQLNYAYDSSGNISTVTDALGKIVETHTYDSNGRGLTSSRANGVDTVTVQYPAPGTTTLTDSLSNSTTYSSKTIAGRGFISGIQGPGCDSCGGRNNQSFTQDSSGNRLSTTDPNGNTTSFTYDANGNVLTKTDWAGTSTYTYNNFTEVLTVKDPLGYITTNVYDANGNLTSTTTPSPDGGTTAGSKTQFAYDSKGELTQVTDPLGRATTLTYFSTGLINTIKDVQRNVTTFAYDGRGNRTSVKDALNNSTTFAYDTINRLTKITYPNTSTTQMAYDKRGRRTSVTDANSKTTAYVYDDADRLTSTTDPATNVTQYAYDTENHLASITDALNHTTTFTYDFLGRVTKTLFPSNLSETYLYDNNGNLTSKTDRNGNTISYVYDQVNRLTQKSYPNSTAVNYSYDADSRLTQVTDPTGTYSFTFDNIGRLTATTTGYAFLSGRNFTTHYAYDAASNRNSFTDPESGSTSYGYDTLNRLTSLTPPSAISSGSFGFSYDALSRRTRLTRPNAVNTNYTYDTLSRLLSVTHGTSGHGATTLDGASYTVDPAGNRTSRTSLPSGTATNYAYDAVYELLNATQGGTTKESYSYDTVGNRLSSLGVPSYVYNSSNELTSSSVSTFTFDYNGNTQTKVVGSNTTSYSWDFENRMSSVTLPGSGGTVTFKYDPFGRRIKKVTSTTTSIFAYDQDNLIEETNASGGVVARYTQTDSIDEPVAMLRSGATSYYEQDGLGSVTSLSNTAGSLAQTYTFDSFGKQTASSGSLTNPFQFTGREFDGETSLYFYRARYFDSAAGRFLSEDPMRFFESPNFYAYVENNPLNLIDTSGLQAQRPDNLPLGTPQQYWGPFSDGFNEALNRLNNTRCADEFEPPCDEGPGPSAANQMRNTSYRFLNLGSPSTGAATAGPTDVFINTIGVYMTAKGGGIRLPNGFTCNLGNATNVRAFILLHELGHQLKGNTGFTTDVDDASTNSAHSMRIIKACFQCAQ